jgi:hypothetical protein
MHCTPPDSDTSLAFPARPEHTCRYSRSCSYCCSLPSTLLPKQNTSTSQNLCSLPLIRELQGMVDSPMCRSDTQTVDCHIWSACINRAPCRASTTGCYRKLGVIVNWLTARAIRKRLVAPGTYSALFRQARAGWSCCCAFPSVHRLISGGRGQNREQQQAGTAHAYSLEPAEAASIIGNASFLRAWALCQLTLM